jgi:hypothetical protein
MLTDMARGIAVGSAIDRRCPRYVDKESILALLEALYRQRLLTLRQ